MIELGVNIDHVATLRQVRRTYEPDPVWAAVEAHLGGADGITVHLREDRRHIQDADVRRLREQTHIKLNLEMAATAEMVDIALALKPEAAIGAAIGRLADAGITTSVFIDAEPAQVEAAARVGASVCELHTGPYAEAFHRDGRDVDSPAIRREIDRVAEAGRLIQQAGMRFNAGHGLNYFNVQPIAALPGVRELHIGHAIVSRAVFVGLREAVASLKALMREAAADAQQRRLLRG